MMSVPGSTFHPNVNWLPSAIAEESRGFDEIADRISDLWIGTKEDFCVGAVFTWVIKGCPNLDNTDSALQKKFQEYQTAYLAATEEETTYLPVQILQENHLEEELGEDIDVEYKNPCEIAKLIVEEWNFLNRKKQPAMIVLSHPDHRHAYGINKNSSGKYQLFDARFSQLFEADTLEEFTLGLEAHVVGSTAVLQKRNGGTHSDSFNEIQIVSYATY
jgi:hypothetical protein